LGDKFYQTGIDLAQKIVDGLQAKLDELGDLLPDMTIPQLKDTLNGIAPEVKKIIDGASAATSVVSTGNAEYDSIIGRFGGKARDIMLERAGFTAFAEGGIVKSAQLGLVGEKGPEAIIPLDRLNSMGGGGTTINLTVNAGMGADGRNISDTIVNELIKYQRRNGKIPVVTL
jgi:phage-related minor tail protein